jgi:acetylornithine deacetylase/succinyl-diaminopimelate desuccinylase-like protein
MQSINTLPERQRDANLKALRQEIDSLSPRQKQEMADHFQAEFKALPTDEQDKLRAALAAAQSDKQGTAQ